MSLRFNGTAFYCESTHGLICESPPELAIRQYYSWGQLGVVEILGGRMGRPLYVDCWIHSQTFVSVAAIDEYLKSLDRKVGEVGTLELTITGSVITRPNCRFVGFKRVPFRGQERPEILQVVGPNTASYGSWHIAGELHFFQQTVEE